MNEGRSGLSPDFGIDKAALARLCGSCCDISHRRATFEHGFMEQMVAGERTIPRASSNGWVLGEKKPDRLHQDHRPASTLEDRMSYAESALRGCRTIAFAATLLWSAVAAAQQEVPGAKDFPLIKRYEGSRLIGYDSRAFDLFKLLLGKLKSEGGYAAYDAVREVEGRHTRLLYLAPPQRSSLEVFRNYEADLAAKGFTVLFKCSGAEECEFFLRHGNVPGSLSADPQVAEQRTVQGRVQRPGRTALPRRHPVAPGRRGLGLAVRRRGTRRLRGVQRPRRSPARRRRGEADGSKDGDGRCGDDGQGHRGDRAGRALRALLRHRQGRPQAGIGDRRSPRSASC